MLYPFNYGSRYFVVRRFASRLPTGILRVGTLSFQRTLFNARAPLRVFEPMALRRGLLYPFNYGSRYFVVRKFASRLPTGILRVGTLSFQRTLRERSCAASRLPAGRARRIYLPIYHTPFPRGNQANVQLQHKKIKRRSAVANMCAKLLGAALFLFRIPFCLFGGNDDHKDAERHGQPADGRPRDRIHPCDIDNVARRIELAKHRRLQGEN